MPHTPLSPETIAELQDLFGPDLQTQPDFDTCFTHDESGLSRTPEAVAEATSAEQISALLRLANERNFAVTPRGAGTGLAGGALAECGGVVLSMTKMDRIIDIDADNLVAVVEPGVITARVREAAKDKGLFFPPDPAGLDRSTIGGNAATNAGGPACVKYGVTKDYVLGLRVVLPSGEIVDTGASTRKRVVGYDLMRLLVGSEGTLGVITELRLKLIPHPRAVTASAVLFSDPRRAVQTVGAVMAKGVTPSALELMDHKCLRLVHDLLPFPLHGDTPSLLLIETDGDKEQVERDMERILDVCREHGALKIIPASTEAQRAKLWDIRRQISLRIHDAAAIYASEDVVVPIARIPDLIDALPGLEAAFDLTIFAFGHAGDGNIHLNIISRDNNAQDRMQACLPRVIKIVLDLDGAMSGEHGIGVAKKPFIEMELPPTILALQRQIKTAFDPNGVLNPGKIF